MGEMQRRRWHNMTDAMLELPRTNYQSTVAGEGALCCKCGEGKTTRYTTVPCNIIPQAISSPLHFRSSVQ